ncbi:MAG: hypothetical protein AMXMBFR81_21330 [Chthonomonas sp.]
MAGPPGSAFPPPKQGPPAWLLWTAAAVLSVGGVLLGLGAAGVFRAKGGDAPPPALRATGTPPDSSLKVEGQPPESPLRATTERRQMPQHLVDWLEHLRKTEESRVAIATEQMADVLILTSERMVGDAIAIDDILDPEKDLTSPPSHTRARRGASSMGPPWAELEEFFHSYPPPVECVQIRDEYAQTLQATREMIMEVAALLDAEPGRDALKALSSMRGTSTGRVDERGHRSDALLQDLCREFDTTPWFRITGDVGQSLFSKFGF